MFKDLGLSERVCEILEKANFITPTEIQEKSIPCVMKGMDIIGRSQTGSGKTLAFGLPALERVNIEEKGVEVLVVCPTRELASQNADEIRKIAIPLNIKTTPVYGGADMNRQISALKNAKIVIGTPGRLLDHIRRRTLKLHLVKILVLDEADEMLDMGFKEDIESILKQTSADRQTIMFSATMPKEIKKLAESYMKSPVMIEVGVENSAIEKVSQNYILCDKEDKLNAMLEIFKKYQPKQAIIFCNTKAMTDRLAESLVKSGIDALPLHGDMRQSQRKKVMDSIKLQKNDANILVATDVAARGIDIKDVDYVINYDLPNALEFYVHRIGRTGRAGKGGNVITIINSRSQLRILSEIERETGANIQEMTFENIDGVNLKSDKEKSTSRGRQTEFGRKRTNTGFKKVGGNSDFGKRKKDTGGRSYGKNFGGREKFGKDKEDDFSKKDYSGENKTSRSRFKDNRTERTDGFKDRDRKPAFRQDRDKTFEKGEDAEFFGQDRRKEDSFAGRGFKKPYRAGSPRRNSGGERGRGFSDGAKKDRFFDRSDRNFDGRRKESTGRSRSTTGNDDFFKNDTDNKRERRPQSSTAYGRKPTYKSDFDENRKNGYMGKKTSRPFSEEKKREFNPEKRSRPSSDNRSRFDGKPKRKTGYGGRKFNKK